MAGPDTRRRLRGAIGNAILWGAGWSALGLGVLAALRLAGAAPDLSVLDGVGLVAKFGIIGVVTGTAFSAAIGLLYRHRRLQDISAVRFGIGGAVLAGVFVPTFFQVMNVLSGDGMVPMQYVLDDSVWATVFGGIAAAGSLKLAQRAAASTATTTAPLLGSAQSANQLASPHIAAAPVESTRERDTSRIHTR